MAVKTVADADKALEILQTEKRTFLEKNRGKARIVSKLRDELVAADAAAVKVAAMSDDERQAVAAELTRIGGN